MWCTTGLASRGHLQRTGIFAGMKTRSVKKARDFFMEKMQQSKIGYNSKNT